MELNLLAEAVIMAFLMGGIVGAVIVGQLKLSRKKAEKPVYRHAKPLYYKIKHK